MSKPTLPKESVKMLKKKLASGSPKIIFLALFIIDMAM